MRFLSNSAAPYAKRGIGISQFTLIAAVPVPFKEKGPKIKEWQHLRIGASNRDQWFPDDAPPDSKAEQNQRLNIGIQFGLMSKGLTDVDLDCDEALTIAPPLLPKTTAIFGRSSKRASHWFYYTTLAADLGTKVKGSEQFRDPNKPDDKSAMFLELRYGGNDKAAHTVVPGSVHSSGELIEWEDDCSGEPSTTDGADLFRKCGWIASVILFALLAECWGAA